jgi:hypothetical protein
MGEQMNYTDLRLRCHRIIGFAPNLGKSTLFDVIRYLDGLPRYSRAIAAEMLARELAEFVEEHGELICKYHAFGGDLDSFTPVMRMDLTKRREGK